jgi:LPPG:FO 2-phospho-L-lactate transferase
MTDDRVATIVQTVEMGELPFPVYFVEHQCRPTVTGFRFAGIETARMAPGVSEALERADLIVICPSNPWVSISPILQVPGLRSIVERKPVAAVSPIIQGKAVKGPAAKMYAELGWEPSALTVARHYGPLLAGFILDRTDAPLEDAIRQSGIIPYATNTLMVSSEDRYRLADDVVSFGETLIRRQTEP